MKRIVPILNISDKLQMSDIF